MSNDRKGSWTDVREACLFHLRSHGRFSLRARVHLRNAARPARVISVHCDTPAHRSHWLLVTEETRITITAEHAVIREERVAQACGYLFTRETRSLSLPGCFLTGNPHCPRPPGIRSIREPGSFHPPQVANRLRHEPDSPAFRHASNRGKLFALPSGISFNQESLLVGSLCQRSRESPARQTPRTPVQRGTRTDSAPGGSHVLKTWKDPMKEKRWRLSEALGRMHVVLECVRL